MRHLFANAAAQVVTATVPAGNAPDAVAVNTVTNKIYVANFLSKNVTVIDGATNSTTTVSAGVHPVGVAVDEATNKIYVANVGDCGPFGNCDSHGSVTVIDGATNSTITVIDPNANGPRAVAVNSVTNKIYVANSFSSNVTVIDGANNSSTTVTDPNAVGLSVYAVAVNQATNKIYVANNNLGTFSNNPGNITVIDGATNSTTTVTDPNAISPYGVAVNPAKNKIYVANLGLGDFGSNNGNVTVIDGATNSITTLTDANVRLPQTVAVNQTTNKIYVPNADDSALTGIGGVTVMDGTTNAISTVRDPNAMFPHAVAVDSVTNTIYVANQGCFSEDPCINRGSVTIINGATNSVTTIIDPNASNPIGLAVDSSTDKIYVAGGQVTVIDGGATPTTHILSLLLPGDGSGTVTSSPAGINCTVSCTASFAAGTAVDLTASPSSGVTFSGWGTNCTGTGACNVTMTSDDFVTATFNLTTPPDFSLMPASGSLSVQRGGQVTDVMTIAPKNGPFTNAIQLTCTVAGPAPAPTCSLNPTSVTPGANPATSTLTVAAPATAMLAPSARPYRTGPFYAIWLLVSVLGIALVPGSKKRRRYWMPCGFFLLLVLLQAACGGGGSSNAGTNYTVTVTATSGTIQHTAQVTVTVH